MPKDVLLFGATLIAILIFLLWRDRAKKPTSAKPDLPPNSIVVDGSNVMHWGGDPSARVLKYIVKDLEKKGYSPFVIFDASVGYRLSTRYLDDAPMAHMIDVPVDQVLVVAKGVVADEVILKFATEHGMQIVTNDRYRDWAATYPIAKDHRRFRRGVWKEGSVVWHDKRRRKARA